MTLVVFLAATLGFPSIVGLPVALHPALERLSLTARASLAWASGSIALTAILTIASAAGLRWTPWFILYIGVPVTLVSFWLAHKNRPTTSRLRISGTLSGGFAKIAIAIVGSSSLFGFVVGAATSADLSYFWGAKAIHFALARGIDFGLLQQAHMIHLHPNYPPLWSVLLGWGAMVAQSMPWTAIPSLTWFCLTAAAVIIFSVFRTRVGQSAAAAVTCLWYAVLGTMMVTSFSGGNADGPLVLFSSIALAIILTERHDEAGDLRWIAAIALTGAVFTKSEGGVAVALIVIGTAMRDAIWRRPFVFRETVHLVAPAITAFVIWASVRFAQNLPLTDPIRETVFQIRFDNIDIIARICLRFLTTGVIAVGWLVPLLSVILVGRNRLAQMLPGIVTAGGVLAFSVFYYLHVSGDPFELIVWTFPRLIQPAMSAWILGLGAAAFSIVGDSQSDATSRRGVTT